MPHERPRLALPLLLKQTHHFPVVGLIGVRQCGKSFLLREIVSKKLCANYVSLDSKTIRNRAVTAPDAFTERLDKRTLIIDEIQKAPDLFDSIKFHVDEKRIPGSYIISGSTKFSKETGIRESLTGRILTVKLFPLISAEFWKIKTWQFIVKQSTSAVLSLAQLESRIKRGGMPGQCFIRDENAFSKAADLWLETTCFRDLQQVRGRTLSGDMALQILTRVAQEQEPTAANIAKRVHCDTRTVTRYLAAFETIHVLQRIDPHPKGIGKAIYYLCDSGLAYYLGAQEETRLQTFVLHETLATLQYNGFPNVAPQYFRAPKQGRIVLVFSWPRTRGAPRDLVVSAIDTESTTPADFRIFEQFTGKVERAFRLILLTQTRSSYTQDAVEVHPLRG